MNIRSLLCKIRGEVPTDVLVERGLKVGDNFNRMGGTIIDDSHSWLISIGNNVTLAPRVHILSHDASTKMTIGYTRIGLVNIGSNVFVGAESVILPGVSIGDNVVIGAGSVVSKDIPSNSVAVGNPAKVICSYDDFKNRKKAEMDNTISFDESYTLCHKDFTLEKRDEMIKKLKENCGVGYVK